MDSPRTLSDGEDIKINSKFKPGYISYDHSCPNYRTVGKNRITSAKYQDINL